jgi:hypothetical protein
MISGWFVRLTLVLVIVALGAFEGISVLVASVGAKDDAQDAALAAANSYQSNHSAVGAIAAANGVLHDGDTLVPGSVRAAADGTVSLQVRRTASSILLHRWSTSAKWDVVTGSASSKPAQP